MDSASDPTYVHSALSWSNDPSVWEAARAQLAGIIAGASNTGPLVAPILDLPSTLAVTAQISASYPPGYSISTYQWTITPATPPNSSQASHAAAASAASIITFTTANGAAPLAPLNLALGYYRISVIVTDPFGHVSPPATAYVTLVSPELTGMRIYPNPWRADRHKPVPITFDHLTSDATISVFTVSGHLVRRLSSSGGIATWDLNNDSGDRVGSGIYLYVVKTSDGQSSRGQLALIK